MTQTGEFKPYTFDSWLRQTHHPELLPERVEKKAEDEPTGIPKHHFAKMFGISGVPLAWLSPAAEEGVPVFKDWFEHKVDRRNHPVRTTKIQPGFLKRVGIKGAKGLAPAVIASLASGAILDAYIQRKLRSKDSD